MNFFLLAAPVALVVELSTIGQWRYNNRTLSETTQTIWTVILGAGITIWNYWGLHSTSLEGITHVCAVVALALVYRRVYALLDEIGVALRAEVVSKTRRR